MWRECVKETKNNIIQKYRTMLFTTSQVPMSSTAANEKQNCNFHNKQFLRRLFIVILFC